MKAYVFFNNGGRPSVFEANDLKEARQFAGEFLLKNNGSQDHCIDAIIEGTLNLLSDEITKVEA